MDKRVILAVSERECFGALIDILIVAFSETVSISDYFEVVKCIREYEIAGHADVTEERIELQSRGWAGTYHQCNHMENVRKGVGFAPVDNAHLGECIAQYRSSMRMT